MLLWHVLASLMHNPGSYRVHRTTICLPATSHRYSLALEIATGPTNLLALRVLGDVSKLRVLTLMRPAWILRPPRALIVPIATPLLDALPDEDTSKDAAEAAEHAEHKAQYHTNG